MDIRWGQMLTYWLDIKDLWLDKAAGSEYVKEISGIEYGIKSYMMTRPSVRPKIEYGVVGD